MSKSSWLKPNVEFVDMNPESEGSKLFNQVIPQPSSHMAQRCIDVAKSLYSDPKESSRFHHLKFELREKSPSGKEFVAYKTGEDGSGEMTIVVSTSYLAKIHRKGGNSIDAIKNEIDGILFHEVTHGYNNSPLTKDDYSQGDVFWAYTEGLADAVRIGAGYHKTRKPDVSNPKKWLSGYTTTGFFLHYVQQKIDPHFVAKLNQSAKDMGNYTWSWNSAFLQIINRPVQDVWDEYELFVNKGGKLDY